MGIGRVGDDKLCAMLSLADRDLRPLSLRLNCSAEPSRPPALGLRVSLKAGR